MQKYLFAAITTVLFYACALPDKNQIPADVLSQHKMESILFDMHLAEGVVGNNPEKLDSNARKALGYYQMIYAKHQVSEEAFKKSFDFYTAHPVLLDSVYSHVIERLSLQENLLRK